MTVVMTFGDAVAIGLFALFCIAWICSTIHSAYKRWKKGECVFGHQRSELVNVASVGGGAQYRCHKCNILFWKNR